MAFEYEGTVSHGTMRIEDLIPAFMDALDRLREDATFLPDAGDTNRVAEYGRMDDLLGAMERRMESDCYFASEDCDWDLEALFDFLDGYAPEGYYFGAHEGDGSDFGFWPVPDED